MSVVVPFRAARARPRDFQIVMRRDLATGVVASGAVRADTNEAPLVETLLSARMRWRDLGEVAPLALPVSGEVHADAASAGAFCATLQAAGVEPRSVDLEIDESALVRHEDLSGLERMRARGFGLVLVCDATCALPLGQRTRRLFTEIAMPAPARLDAFAALDPSVAAAPVRRLMAARGAGLPVTATGRFDRTWARALAAAGFDRGEDADPV